MMSATAAAPQGGPLEPESFSPAHAQEQVGTWEWNFGTQVFAVDPLWCEALRLHPCKGPNHLEAWARQIHPDDVAEFQRKQEAVRSGRLERFELEYRVLVHETRWLWLLQRGRVVERGTDGHTLRVTGICLEIDERKRAEVALQENEARLATALWGARAA